MSTVLNSVERTLSTRQEWNVGAKQRNGADSYHLLCFPCWFVTVSCRSCPASCMQRLQWEQAAAASGQQRPGTPIVLTVVTCCISTAALPACSAGNGNRPLQRQAAAARHPGVLTAVKCCIYRALVLVLSSSPLNPMVALISLPPCPAFCMQRRQSEQAAAASGQQRPGTPSVLTAITRCISCASLLL
jgi:hypothetical protein